MTKPNSFCFTPMVRVEISYGQVDEATRLKISKIIFDPLIKQYRGGGGGNGNYMFYISPDEVEELQNRLSEVGFDGENHVV